jgi:hypothetical protein
MAKTRYLRLICIRNMSNEGVLSMRNKTVASWGTIVEPWKSSDSYPRLYSPSSRSACDKVDYQMSRPLDGKPYVPVQIALLVCGHGGLSYSTDRSPDARRPHFKAVLVERDAVDYDASLLTQVS